MSVVPEHVLDAARVGARLVPDSGEVTPTRPADPQDSRDGADEQDRHQAGEDRDEQVEEKRIGTSSQG
jgi:hypothetical protein